MAFFSSSVDFSGRWKPHIWGFFGLAFVLMLLMTGCGLPNYVVIPKPIRIESIPNSSTLAFTTPTDTTVITGYVVYYKVYTNDSDFDAEDDVYFLDEQTYINENDEMQPGSYIPASRGFVRAGLLDTINPTTYTYEILDPGPSTNIYIDFDYVDNRGFSNKDSPDPAVMYGTYPSTIESQLARGVTDPTTSGTPSFLHFANDWDFFTAGDEDEGNEYNDADLYRKKPLSQTTDVSLAMTGLMGGTPLVDLIDSPLVENQDRIWIGVSVYSKGVDASNLQLVESKPIYIGRIEYRGVADIDRELNRD